MFRQPPTHTTFYTFSSVIPICCGTQSLGHTLTCGEAGVIYCPSETESYTFTFSASSQMAFTKRSQLKRFLYLVMFSESMVACPEV